MKKIELIKEYQGKKKGHVAQLRTGRADYLIRMGIAREIGEGGEKKAPAKAKVTKANTVPKEKKAPAKAK